ncbi:hypothetical protein OIU78_004509 [Salix suchowensis]|nr:hypothetical protein OIU78_004509 [Salix suchowensis]
MVVVEVIVEWVLNGSLESHGMQERNREEEVKKREGILVTREMGGPGQADSAFKDHYGDQLQVAVSYGTFFFFLDEV